MQKGMHVGEPDFITPMPIIEAAHKAMLDGFTKYTEIIGSMELRKEICKKLSSKNSHNTQFY